MIPLLGSMLDFCQEGWPSSVSFFFFFLNGSYGMVGSLPQRISFGHCCVVFFFLFFSFCFVLFLLRKKRAVGEGPESPFLCEFCDSEFKRLATGSGSQIGFPSCVEPCASHVCPFKCWDESPHSVLFLYLVT